jgi:hypothetical protein
LSESKTDVSLIYQKQKDRIRDRDLNKSNGDQKMTLEILAEKLNGKVWIKGDMKRVYLDRGYNTKKMSTKTYIYQKEDGTFGVSCYIECPSQPLSWIKSQQVETINAVMSEIEEVLNPSIDEDAN